MGRPKKFCCERKHHLQFGNCLKDVQREEISPYKRILWKIYVSNTLKEFKKKYTETDRIVDVKIDQLLIRIWGESSSDSECNWYGSSEDKLN